ncbi:AbrB/MazE/SpoVT family DNA-binding domain-containing protein [Azospirillum sp.]|uniref:AbrB/MazE/SpoVT family DNA-binding domain-containing protein n=1 Tax=Azospirillum sp. TaxID=34012 RepID=UPI002D24B68C|nr:AbrB/MazE/SpoVT family DNA-binding domain-containing protein [Azospirillum sp.]HYD69597.1 AbrB/MazE/SpoVT family DNA-binding domain-containing protein [Azospirillum sp.]
MATAVTGKGQVTIPKAVRDHLGLTTGSMVEFEVTPDGRVALMKAVADRPAGRFARLRGCAGKGPTTDEILTMTRGEDGHDAR